MLRHLFLGAVDRLFPVTAANKGCGVWMMSSSLPHVTSNHVSYNGLYGVAVFSQKDGSGEFPGGHGAQENFSEDGDAILWETELEKEDDPLRRPVTVALVESNSINHNGGECAPAPVVPSHGSRCPGALHALVSTCPSNFISYPIITQPLDFPPNSNSSLLILHQCVAFA